MDKKKITCIAIMFLSAAIVYLIFTWTSIKKNHYYHDMCLDALRVEIRDELLKNHINTPQTLIIDNVCKLVNNTGVCYFNASMQALFANRLFTLFVIMTKFNFEQRVCVIMQKIAYKMLTNQIAYLMDELVELSNVNNTNNSFKKVGGDPTFCIPQILGLMDDECYGVDFAGSPHNFLYREKVNFKCDQCKELNVYREKYFIYDIDFGNNFAQCFVCSLKVKNYESNHRMHQCRNCKDYALQKNLKFDLELPENLIIENGRVRRKYRKLEYLSGHMEIYEKVMIEAHVYELYAILCTHGTLADFHVNTIAKKGDKWYLLNDTEVDEIKLNDNRLVKYNSWLYLYRLID